jgi:cysteine desulfurase
MMMLDFHNIAVSSGSACSSQSNTPSYVLKAIGLSDKEAAETIRISLGKDTRKRDINYTVDKIKNF